MSAKVSLYVRNYSFSSSVISNPRASCSAMAAYKSSIPC
nr:MAG TPA: hypothetical protein [Caudoviricetes sp.]